MTKAERAVRALREAADALEACPIRKTDIFGTYNSIDRMRAEADHIEQITAAVKEALEDA